MKGNTEDGLIFGIAISAIIVTIVFAVAVFEFIYPQMADQICHTNGYGNFDSYTIKGNVFGELTCKPAQNATTGCIIGC